MFYESSSKPQVDSTTDDEGVRARFRSPAERRPVLSPHPRDVRRDRAVRAWEAGVARSGENYGEALTLVVGYDGSDEAQAALATAVERAGANGTVVAVHATTPVSSWLGAPYYDTAVEKRQLAGRAILDEVRQHTRAARARIELELLDGSAANALMRVAAARDADAIVVGSRGLGRVRSAVGSVSRAVLQAADRPVLVVPRSPSGRTPLTSLSALGGAR
jgi:nucleotide-binding universal stress UspA family protein